MILWNDKDGGPESRVWCWGLEVKRAFSVLVLRFDEGSREAFHTHAFNSMSWVLSGMLSEDHYHGDREQHWPRLLPVVTLRSTYHKVSGLAPRTWVITIRGPWSDTWREFHPPTDTSIKLTHGRKEL